VHQTAFCFFDYFISNEEVKSPKPSPEIYLKCIIRAKVSSRETLIMEDSDVGRKAAILSSSHLCEVIDPDDLTIEKISESIKNAEDSNLRNEHSISGRMKNLNVVIPMAGKGSRFAVKGYPVPKPLIEVGRNKTPMIKVVTDNLNFDAHHIFIVQKEHFEKYNLGCVLKLIKPDCTIIQLDEITEGTVCSVLKARHLIDNDIPLVIANSDQFLGGFNASRFLYQSQNVDGSMITFKAYDTKWSFAKLDEDGFVSEVAEKKCISDNATVGVYLWNKGSEFVKYADQMIKKNIRVNNEFYTCPVYNEAISEGKKFKIIEISTFYGLGVPEDLEFFNQEYKGNV
jgi:dTDP-glucose pyrophosphorylase